jgi:hypothetical protein
MGQSMLHRSAGPPGLPTALRYAAPSSHAPLRTSGKPYGPLHYHGGGSGACGIRVPFRFAALHTKPSGTSAAASNLARRPGAPPILGSPHRPAVSRPPGGRGGEGSERVRICYGPAAAPRIILVASVGSLPSAGASARVHARRAKSSKRSFSAYNVRLAGMSSALRGVWLRKPFVHSGANLTPPGGLSLRAGPVLGQQNRPPPYGPTRPTVGLAPHAMSVLPKGGSGRRRV